MSERRGARTRRRLRRCFLNFRVILLGVAPCGSVRPAQRCAGNDLSCQHTDLLPRPQGNAHECCPEPLLARRTGAAAVQTAAFRSSRGYSALQKALHLVALELRRMEPDSALEQQQRLIIRSLVICCIGRAVSFCKHKIQAQNPSTLTTPVMPAEDAPPPALDSLMRYVRAFVSYTFATRLPRQLALRTATSAAISAAVMRVFIAPNPLE